MFGRADLLVYCYCCMCGFVSCYVCVGVVLSVGRSVCSVWLVCVSMSMCMSSSLV